MSETISFYPIFDSSIFTKFKANIDYTLSYVDDEYNTVNVPFEINSKRYINIDIDNTKWNYNDYDLKVHLDISLINADILYGVNPIDRIDGIAPNNSKLAIGLEYYSTAGKIRNVIASNDYVKKDKEKQFFSFDLNIPKRSINTNLNLNLIIYLSEEANPVPEGEAKFNNQAGVVLGSISNNILCIEGNNSLFPIYNKAINSNKLWEIELNYEDPSIDQFSECMKIILNTNHKDYKYIDTKSPEFIKSMLFEIIANALTMMIVRVKETEKLDDNKVETANEGSILYLIQYYQNIMDLDITNVLSISKTIRDFLSEKEI